LHPWCCTVVQLHLSSPLIPDSALFVICANFSFLYARRKQHDADQSAVGELYWIYIPLYLCPVIQFIQCTMLLRPYTYPFIYIPEHSPYISRVRSCRLVRVLSRILRFSKYGLFILFEIVIKFPTSL
jgi:hypothetical protein